MPTLGTLLVNFWDRKTALRVVSDPHSLLGGLGISMVLDTEREGAAFSQSITLRGNPAFACVIAWLATICAHQNHHLGTCVLHAAQQLPSKA